jgi:secondary thiamine-phosphate synthase enzyme
MAIFKKTFSINTKGNTDIVDITEYVKKIVEESNLNAGIVNIFVVGSTASITTIEFEEGLLVDFKNALEKLIPYDKNYRHHLRWNDDNAHSHIRASIIGPETTIPFENKNLLIGRWQQIVLVDFDTRPRTREIIVSCIGN